jgi:hypothetical protein
VPGAQEMGKAARGHDVARADPQLVVSDGYFFFFNQGVMNYISGAI